MTDHVVHHEMHHEVEGVIAKGVLRWLVGGGLMILLGAAAWVAVTNARLEALEKYSVSREEVVKLNGSMDLLRLEIQQLRTDIGNIRQGP